MAVRKVRHTFNQVIRNTTKSITKIEFTISVDNNSYLISMLELDTVSDFFGSEEFVRLMLNDIEYPMWLVNNALAIALFKWIKTKHVINGVRKVSIPVFNVNWHLDRDIDYLIDVNVIFRTY